MRSYTAILLLTLLTSVSLYAQPDDSEAGYALESTQDEPSYTTDPGNLSPTKNYSDEDLTVRKFDRKKWKEVVGSARYRKEASRQANKSGRATGADSTQASSVKKSGKRYAPSDSGEEQDAVTAGESPWSGPLFKIVFYGLVIFVVAMILYYIIRNTSLRSDPKNIRVDSSALTAPVEDIASLDVNTMLERTQAAGDYRLAIRISFLGLLKKLDEAGFIRWKKDKTNRDYLTELRSKALYFEEVRRLTLAYEQVWYGEHAIPAELYHQLRAEFNDVDQQLTKSGAR